MRKKQEHCADCAMRKKYDRSPKSLLGRFWRWHIDFCPGWKAYFTNLDEDEKAELRNKYRFTKY